MTFLDPLHGGRKTPANQGYRPDVEFAGPMTFMINPEFLGEDGSSYPIGASIPMSVRANMYVINEESRPLVRKIVRVGLDIRIVEGTHAVATAVVTQIKNLPNEL